MFADLRKNPDPIVTTLMQTDFYKLTTGFLIWSAHGEPGPTVGFSLTNRTKHVRIADIIDEQELREELDEARKLKGINKTEQAYLRGINEYADRMFPEVYIQFLANLQLPPYELRKVDGNYELTFTGLWRESTHWEIYALQIVIEILNRALLRRMTAFERDQVFAEGIRRLAEKIKILKARPDVVFCDFGNRRAFSRNWHAYVVEKLTEELSQAQFQGTSNTHLAMQHGVTPMGTYPHEPKMVYAALAARTREAFIQSQRQMLADWRRCFGQGLAVLLPDTYGSPFFFKEVLPREDAAYWRAVRQDSGDPFAFGDNILLPFWESCGVNPLEKILIFSDGLELPIMLKLTDHFGKRTIVRHGWGTSLTNDLLRIPEIGFMPLSLVVKPYTANGRGTVKLSDNIAKAIGKPEDIEWYRHAAAYDATYQQECVY